jgi:hypothetical protein
VVTAPWPKAVSIPLGIIFVWGALSPGLLGIAYATDVRADALLNWWRPGWMVVTAAGLAMAWAAGRAQPDPWDRRVPELCRSGLPWILAVLVVTAVGMAQILLARGMFLSLRWPDLMAPAVAMLLTLDGHAWAWKTIQSRDRTALWVVAWLLALLGTLATGWEQPLAWDHFWCHPPLALVLMGGGLVVNAVRHRHALHLIPQLCG